MSAAHVAPEQAEPADAATVLRVEDLRVDLVGRGTRTRMLDGVSLHVARGETLAVLGESGCGKTLTARAVMDILPRGLEVSAGRIELGGRDVTSLSAAQRRKLHGPVVSMVFQDALSALNPVVSVGAQVAECFRMHRGYGRRQAFDAAVGMLDTVGIPAAARRARNYPHQFSGGMRQRVMIAMALALDPQVLIADEPTTALDVTVQAQVLELLKDLQRDNGMGIMLITHDMGVVGDVADRAVVMYAGRVAEQAPADALFTAPAHPYTRALLDAVPQGSGGEGRLHAIAGAPPDLAAMPHGCPFAPRCAMRVERCATVPPLDRVAPDHAAACHRWPEVRSR